VKTETTDELIAVLGEHLGIRWWPRSMAWRIPSIWFSLHCCPHLAWPRSSLRCLWTANLQD